MEEEDPPPSSTPSNPLTSPRSRRDARRCFRRPALAVGFGDPMADDDDGVGRRGGRPRASDVSARGIYRRKHALRAAFRCASLVLLVGGYALYYRLGDGGAVGPEVLRGLRRGDAKDSIRTNSQVREEGRVSDGGAGDFSRRLQNESVFEDGANAVEDTIETLGAAANEKLEECPEVETADPSWLAVFYAVGVLYMFLALAIVCDEFFVPALEEMSSDHHLNLSMDVAGATLMAAGGSAPELFTSFVGTFKQSDIGIGTIVGSAVFNVLFVIGMCSLLSKEVLTLTWWPLFRDSAYYALGLVVLCILAGVISEGIVYWWEALILLGMYLGYVAFMYYNRKIYKKLTGKELHLPGEDDEEEEMAQVGEVNGAAEAAPTPVVNVVEASENGEAKKKENGDSNGPSSPGREGFFVDSSNTNTTAATSALTQPNPPNRATDGPSPKGGAPARDFRWPGTFRAGVLKLLLHPESWELKGGIGIVAKIQGDVDHVFRQIDINGDGSIDREELGKLFQELGEEISEEELEQVFASLDLDGNGTVSDLWISIFRVRGGGGGGEQHSISCMFLSH
ncbi:hypothetical protein ACHAWF_006151 [Thalassiosira exigua]